MKAIDIREVFTSWDTAEVNLRLSVGWEVLGVNTSGAIVTFVLGRPPWADGLPA